MVVTGAVLFLIGTITFTNANLLEPTEIIVEKHINPTFTEKLTNYGLQSGLPPFISNFMEHGTNIFFKPQFMLSPSYAAADQGMMTDNKEDCKKWPMIPAMPFAMQPQIVMDEPVKIVETIVSSGEPPVVDKIVVIKPPMPLAEIPERPFFISPLPKPAADLPIINPMDLSDTSVVAPLPLIPVPVINTSVTIPQSIPAAPELPPLEIPQAPVVSEEPVEVPMVEAMEPATIEEIKPVPVSEIPEPPPLPILENIPSLPLTPVLPATSIPAAPELPPLDIAPAPVVLDEPVDVPMVETTQPAVFEEIRPVVIHENFELPPPPVLESLVPSLPLLPLLQIAAEPASHPEPAPYVEVYETNIPLHIPEAPELPPYSPPPLPVPVILPESLRECDKTPALVETPIVEIQPETVVISDAPTLPAVVPETLPSNPPTLIEEPVIIPQPPVLPSPTLTLADIIVPQPALEPTLTQVTPPEPIVIEQVKPAEPIAIPSPPKLAPISMPDLPISVVVSEPKAPEVPLLVESQPVLIQEPVIQSIKIPASPVLPPMTPIEVISFPPIHDAPVIIAETSPLEQEIISNEIPLAEDPEPVLPVVIAETPLLPPVPEIPSPVATEEMNVSNDEANPATKPFTIPPAPELPPLEFQPVPIPFEEPVMGLYPSAELKPFIIEEHKLPSLDMSNSPFYMTLAEAPIAPAPIIIPQEVQVVDKISSPALSTIESIISFPTTCVKNIVIERVLPNIAREGIQVVSSPSPNYPVLSPLSSTIGIRLF